MPATFRRIQLDSREDLRKRFRVRDRAYQISPFSYVSMRAVVVVLIDSIFDVAPPSSSVLFDHFCAKNLMRFLKIFVARVSRAKNNFLFLFCALAKVNTVNDISVLSSILCALCDVKQMFVLSEMFFKSTWY